MTIEALDNILDAITFGLTWFQDGFYFANDAHFLYAWVVGLVALFSCAVFAYEVLLGECLKPFYVAVHILCAPCPPGARRPRSRRPADGTNFPSEQSKPLKAAPPGIKMRNVCHRPRERAIRPRTSPAMVRKIEREHLKAPAVKHFVRGTNLSSLCQSNECASDATYFMSSRKWHLAVITISMFLFLSGLVLSCKDRYSSHTSPVILFLKE